VSGCPETAFDQSCTYTCQDGHAGGTITCSDGQWDAEPICEPIAAYCPRVETAAGFVEAAPLGAIVNTSCTDEINQQTLECLHSDSVHGKWSSSVICHEDLIATSCPLVDSIEGVLVGCNEAEIGGSCPELECAVGYTRATNLICENTGDWSQAAVCVKVEDFCPSVAAAAEHGVTGCDGAQIGSVCEPTCAEGFAAQSLNCTFDAELKGVWHQEIVCFEEGSASCIAQQGIVEHAVMVCEEGSVGDSCTVVCEEGFTANVSTVTCGEDSEWAPYSCVAIDNYCAPIDGCGATALHQECDPTCPDGQVADKLLCMTSAVEGVGEFSGTVECVDHVEFGCEDVPAPEFATRGCLNSDGDACAHECEVGYTANAGIFCVDGEWSDAPTCTAVPDFCAAKDITVEHGVTGCDASAVGAECRPACEDGWVSYNTLVCQNVDGQGVWAGEMKCVDFSSPICMDIDAPVVGGVLGCESGTVGTTCDVQCSAGFVGSQIVCEETADGLDWSSEAVCTPIADFCAAVEAVNCEASVIDTECIPVCDDGFVSQSAVCTVNGEWSVEPRCIPNACEATNAPDFALSGCDGAVVGQTCNVVCRSGYTAVGPVCTAAGWDGEASCVAIAEYCEAVEGCESTVNSVCTPTCAPGMRGTTGQCVAQTEFAGSWSIAPVCRPIQDYCKATEDMMGTGCSDASLGEMCDQTCNAGFVAKEVTCLYDTQESGKWSSTEICVPTPCSNLAVAHSNYADQQVVATLGDVFKVQCDRGYHGGGFIQCLASGEFSDVKCEPNVCTCANGVAATADGNDGTLCEEHGAEDCASCATGFHQDEPADAGTVTHCVGCAPLVVANAEVTSESTTVVTCHAGYLAGESNSFVATCDGANWAYEGACSAVPCPANSVGSSVVDGCVCASGYEGEVVAKADATGFESTCVPAVLAAEVEDENSASALSVLPAAMVLLAAMLFH
jgi:hypothetical protein